MKKMMSLFLAMLMVMALAVPAFAEEVEAPSNEKNMTVTTTVKVPAIEVDVPTTGKIFINPMGFTVKLADGGNATVEEAMADATENQTTSEQIVSPISLITNKSAMKLDVKAYAYATLASGSTISLVDTEAGVTGNDQKAFVYAQFQTIAADARETTYKLTKAAYTAPTDGKSSTLAVKGSAPTEESPATPQIVGTMAPASGTSADEYTYLGFQFFGKVVQEPTTAWADGTTFDVSMVFNFAVNTES